MILRIENLLIDSSSATRGLDTSFHSFSHYKVNDEYVSTQDAKKEAHIWLYAHTWSR